MKRKRKKMNKRRRKRSRKRKRRRKTVADGAEIEEASDTLIRTLK